MGDARMHAPGRRTARIVLVLALLLLALLFAVRFALQPERATRFLLQRAGTALGLEITASGATEYTLRGTPTLVIRGVVAREPGAAVPLLTADRILLSLPWSTIRARGAVLAAQRLELDAPVLRVDALQHWLEGRPPSEAPRFPTLAQGLQVRDGVVQGSDTGWRIAGLAIDLPHLAPDAPLHARIRGRYQADATRVPFDLALALQRAGALVDAEPTGLGVVGRLALSGDGWQLPAHVRLSGPVVLQEGDIAIVPLTAGVGAQYASADSRVPFALGAHGPMRFADGALALAPARLVLRGRGSPGEDPVPDAGLRGEVALADALSLDLDGSIPAWPAAWPELPQPIARPRGPVAVALDYRGPPALTGIVRLRAAHEATRLEGRLRVGAITARTATGMATPLPPLDGRASTAVLEIAGARLEGVQISGDDPDVEAVVE